MTRRLWFTLHSWVGLKLSLFMAFILATGTLAVLAHEIDWLLDPSLRASPQQGPTASWGEWATAVQDAYPESTLLNLQRPIDPWFAVRASVLTADGTLRYVHVNPWTAQVQGEHHFVTAQRILRNTHRHLMLPVQWGVPIVCSLALLLLVSLASSLVIYKRWWRGFFTRPRRGNARRWWGDWHRLIGVWSLWFVALIALTGVWYAVEQLGGAAPAGERFGKLARPPGDARAPRFVSPQIDAAVSAAQATFPGLEIASIALPQSADDPLLVEGQATALLVRERSNVVAVDVEDAAVRGLFRGEQLSLHQRIAEAADPLHFGTWGGLPSRLVWFVFGALLTTLALTGAWLYSLRLRASLRDTQTPGWAMVWRGMGHWRWVSLGLVAASLALTPLLFFP